MHDTEMRCEPAFGIDYTSDLHLDNGLLCGPQGWLGRTPIVGSQDRVLAVAGDTANHVDDTVDVFNAAAMTYAGVVGILGNHERGPRTRELFRNVMILDEHEDRRVDIFGTAFIGACMATIDPVVVESVKARWEEGGDLIVLSHYVPLATLAPLGYDTADKCNGLVDALGPAPYATTVIFGHAHLPADLTIGNYRFVSNPRGYRGRRRDGTGYGGVKAL